MEVTHLLFVDDTLILCNPLKEKMKYLSWAFMQFKAILGLNINIEKVS